MGALTKSKKPDFTDPLNLISWQRCSAADVLGWLQEARTNAKAEAELLATAADDVQRHVIGLRLTTWNEATDRLLGQYRKMTSG